MLVNREIVVLVHGLWMPGASMWLIARRLRRCGFDTRIFSYKTVKRDFRENAERLQCFISQFPGDAAVHFVGHSLGGLIIRALFHYFPQQRPGRIVTLGTPHLGSYAARQLTRLLPFGRAMVGRCIRELLDGAPDCWSLPQRDIGVIAGNLAVGLGRMFPGLPKPNDGTIAVEETRLPRANDHLVLRVSHFSLLLNREVIDQTRCFLQACRFCR